MSIDMDPTAANRGEVAHIFVERFYVKYVQKPFRFLKEGKYEEDPTKPATVAPVEMVSWGKKGQHITTGQKTTQRVSQARRDLQVWAIIGPYYEAWKAGQEAPMDGTPLAAWPGVTPEIVDRLKMLRVRTVEDVAAMTDSDIDNFGMGGLSIRQQARAFCEMKKDRTQVQAEVATQLAARDESHAAQLAVLREEMAALQAKLAEKPRAARPRKQAKAA